MDKRELYDKAKEAYYNGEPIMTDLEFDELERELGLENKGYVGTHHQKSYTVKHPYIMGSLSKVQIKESEDHTIDWDKYTEQIMSYLNKSYKGHERDFWYMEISPKYDGCSWEAVINQTGNLMSVSTRGDGEYGKDITVWFEDEWKKNFQPKIYEFLKRFPTPVSLIVRGECLVDKDTFNEKYSKDFTIPRSFVSGVIGQDWEGTDRQKEMRTDLSWMCYDYRVIYPDGVIEELDYSDSDKYPSLPGEIGNVFRRILPLDLPQLYKRLEIYRDRYYYALDGFVIKPCVEFRLQDGGRARQEDCVAVKFLPMVEKAVLTDVEWNVGKTGEYYPTGILNDVILGGKKVNRVSLANYGSILEKGIGIGSELEISLAGDIIPYILKVLSGGETIKLPEDSYVDGVHLMKVMSEQDKMYIKFLNSVKVLKPDGIGEAVARKLFDIWNTNNIVDFMVYPDKWKNSLDDSKSSQNIITALEERRKTLTLPNLIQSMGYENCGEKNSLYLAQKISGLNPDTNGIPGTIIELGETREFNSDIVWMMETLGIQKLVEEKSDKQYVILTGSPKSANYDTKSDFLVKHPQFAETTRWDQCTCLITDSLDSTSSKMDKAKKKGIPIKTYLDF